MAHGSSKQPTATDFWIIKTCIYVLKKKNINSPVKAINDGTDDDIDNEFGEFTEYMNLSNEMCWKLMFFDKQQQNFIEIHPFIIYRTLLNPIKVVSHKQSLRM